MGPSSRRRRRSGRLLLAAGIFIVGIPVLLPGVGGPPAAATGGRDASPRAFSHRALPGPLSGPSASLGALQKGLSRPAALAAVDLDEDGVPDLVEGLEAIDAGFVTVQLGNPDALYPNSPEARERRARGAFTDSPLLGPARITEVPEAAEFLAAGDFDADDHQDILVGTSGGRVLWFLRGNGRGELAPPKGIALPGGLTALVAGEMGRPLGLPAVIAAVDGDAGPRLVIYDSPEGAARATPVIHPLPQRATALVLGRLDEDAWNDLGVAAGGGVWMLSGTEGASLTPLASGETPDAAGIVAMSLGDFEGRGRPDLAVLGADGALRLLPLRPTPSTTGMEITPRLVRPADARYAGGAVLVRAKLSGRPGDDLILSDAAGRGLAVMAGPERRIDDTTRPTAPVAPQGTSLSPWGTIDLDNKTVAALPMRLGPGALNDLVVLGEDAQLLAIAPAAGVTLTVTNTNDTGTGSLRQAILDANATTVADTIVFNLPGGGPYIIQPHSALPTVTFPVTLDGTTQPGFAGTPIVQIDGSLAGNGVHGLVIAGGASTIRGLVIGGFGGTGTGDGIHLQGAGSDVIEGNYIGSDVTGAMSQPNTGSGVVVDNVPGNTIGGSLDAARNLLSGNAGSGVAILGGSSTTNLVAGDLIGTAAGGKAALGNGGRGVLVSGAPGNTIGISNVFPNIISGNGADGVLITGGTATGTILRGNYVGVDVTNTVGIRNGLAGVRLESSNATVGGSTIGQRNQIGFNGTTGVTIVGGTGNRLMRNGINSDVGLGIDLGDDGVTANDPGDADTGANGLQNDPVLTKVITDASSSSITGTFNSKPATTYTIEFTTSPGCDLSGFGEGKQYFMSTSLTTDAGGNATIALSQPIPLPVHVFLTATATDPAGNTSEYSNCVRVSDQTPDEIAGATWSSTTELDWTAGPGVTSYNVYRGQGSFLPNLLNSAMESCQRLVTGTTTTGMILTELPPQGQIYWYLIDGVNSFGEGTVGDATAGPRSLDSFGACPTCAHEKCAVGGPLSAACNPCVASVCAVNPACCTTQWTSTCVGQVLSVCGSLQCPTSAGACAHLQCVTGSPLSNACDSPPVSPSCVTTVCGADPACCSLTWDATCVEEVGTTCSKTCN